MAKAASAPKSVPETSPIQQIGEAAGEVWKSLDKHGPMSLAKLVERVGGNRDVLMQAIGWLAREDKLDMSETKRGRIIALKPEV